MMDSDEVILNILTEEKRNGNQLLKHFHIQYPSKRVSEESNSIFITTVSSENSLDGFDFSTFKDLVEILIVTKQQDYQKAIHIVKTVTYEICKLILNNRDRFVNRPVIRNVNPEFNRDYVLTRGHILVECVTEPVTFDLTEEEYNICNIYLTEGK